ncbi:MAG: acylneuraminate cytidylyltransferase family protein, partial [bacterium]|nr:acylneuraminate cytidylyltransferase family protein [bacterium]
MATDKKIVALIPLRGGSKGIPYKNIKPLAGKPLAFWACKAATESKYIDEVYVSTEDKKIKETVLSFGLGVKIVDRPKELAEDTSSTESVMLHFAEQVPFDMLVTIQATSPFTETLDFDTAIEQFAEKKYDSLLTGVLYKKFYWTKNGKPLNYDYRKRPRRQEFPGVINENGAFYITKREILEKEKNRLGGKIG